MEQLLETIAGGLMVDFKQHGDYEAEITFPLQGLDGYGIRFWSSFDGRTWHLTDDRHLLTALSGVSEEKLAERISIIARDLPIRISDGALVVHLIGETPEENNHILATAVEAVLSAWALRLEQPVPTVEPGLRDTIASRLRAAGIPFRPNLEIKGRSGLPRRFDLAVGDAGRGLLRAADTDDPSYFQRAAELYIISAADVREARSGLEHNFVFAWNPERLDAPNALVLRELEAAQVIPAGDIESAAAALVA